MPAEVQAVLADISVLQVILWIGVAALLVGFIVKGWPWIKRLVRLVDALGDLPEVIDQMRDLPEVVERIRHQVENDHDTNLREEVTQILDQSNETANTVAELADWQKNHEERSDAIVERIVILEKEKK